MVHNSSVCPICGWEGDNFLPCNSKSQDHSRQLTFDCRCPVCNSHHRHRSYKLILRKFDLPKNNSSILHVAPESFLVDYFERQASEYIKIDKYTEKYDRFEVTKMDLTALNFAESSFDFISCAHVLEHIPDDRKAISEIYRVLKPNGIAVIMVPIYPLKKTVDLYPKSPDIMNHVHQPELDYFSRYKQAGLSVNVYYPENMFDRKKYGLRVSWDPVAICRKSKNPINWIISSLKVRLSTRQNKGGYPYYTNQSLKEIQNHDN